VGVIFRVGRHSRKFVVSAFGSMAMPSCFQIKASSFSWGVFFVLLSVFLYPFVMQLVGLGFCLGLCFLVFYLYIGCSFLAAWGFAWYGFWGGFSVALIGGWRGLVGYG